MTLPDLAVLVPLGIFVAEMCVVTLGTLRIIFIARGRRILAPVLGFFEIMIWLFAISQIMNNLTSVWCFLAFSRSASPPAISWACTSRGDWRWAW
jgi:uncharacterized protein YebE (UPF0316 family)